MGQKRIRARKSKEVTYNLSLKDHSVDFQCQLVNYLQIWI